MIEAYLSELSAALRGPRRAKADLLAEARDHLVTAAEEYESTGLTPQESEQAAVTDFGEPAEIAPGYQTELAWAQGRRTALTVLFVFAAQPFIWTYALPWAGGTPNDSPTNGIVENLGGLTIILALLTVLAYRVGMRYPSVRARITRITGHTTMAVSTLFAVCGALLTAQSPNALVLTWMITFILIPMTWTGLSAHRCLTTTIR